MKRINFIKNIGLIILSPFFLTKKNISLFAKSPQSTTWQITEDCTNCGLCYDKYEKDFKEKDDSAIFKEGHWFNNVFDNGKMANCGTEYYDKVQEVADDCPAAAIKEAG